MQNYDYQIAVQRAGNFLLSEIQTDGAFVYERTLSGELTTASYNMLRHCGTVWALALAQPYLSQELYAAALPKAVAFLKQQLVGCNAADREKAFTLILDNKSAKLGGNALALLALQQVATEDALLSSLADGIGYFLDAETKAVRFSKFNPHTGKVSTFESEYYPGEAALALAAIGRYEDALALVRYVRDTRDKNGPLQDHWMMQALEKLYGDATKFAVTIRADVLELQEELFCYAEQIFLEIKQNPVYLGRCTPTACRAEAAVAYLGILRLRNADSHRRLVHAFSKQLLNILLQYQLQDGAFKGAFVDGKTLRIDYTQHAMTAFLRYLALPHHVLQET